MSATIVRAGWVAARLSQTAEECDGPGVICSNPWGLFAVLDNAGELRLHLRLKSLTNPADPSCVFKKKVTIASDGWSRLELSIAGTMATVSLNGAVVGSGVDVSGPRTAPGDTKSYLPRSGFAALGGGPDYSTDLSFDNFTVTGSSLCPSTPPTAGMTIVGVACGLDVPGLAFDIIGQRIMLRSDHSLCISQAPGNSSTPGLVLAKCSATDTTQDFVYERAQSTLRPAAGPSPAAPSPWQTFTPGQGVPYGKPYKAGDTLTAVRHIARSTAAPFQEEETLEFKVNGVSQGMLKMPELLPDDVVGCVGSCVGAETVTATAPAAFSTSAKAHGRDVAIGAGGATASWSGAKSCNEVALLDGTNRSFSVKLSGSASFVDFGWCSPTLDPAGGWASGAVSGWMGGQGPGKDWIYRSSGAFKASSDERGDVGAKKFCLETVERTDRGQVRPWAAATLSSCATPPGTSACAPWPSCGGAVAYDAELGLLRTSADTTGMCFGVCK